VRVYALRPEAIADLPASSVPLVAPRRRRTASIAISAAVGAVLVLAVSAWWLWPTTKLSRAPEVAAATSTSQPLVAPRLSIVVLPFANLSNDPEQQYFADGITEDLTTDLSHIAHMLVISRNSAFTYKDKPVIRTSRSTRSRSATSWACATCSKGASSVRATTSASTRS